VRKLVEEKIKAVRLGKEEEETEQRLYDEKGNFNPNFFNKLDQPRASTKFCNKDEYADCHE